MTGQKSTGLAQRTRWILLAAITAGTVAADQASKIYAVEHWKGQPPQSFLGDLFRIQYAQNDGAFLSLLSNMSEEVRFWVLTVINGLVLLGMAIYLLSRWQVNAQTFLPLALIVAGGAGNLIDRLRFNYVIDYFNLGIGNLRTGIFNVADMAITAGFVLMIPLLVFSESAPAGPSEPSSEANTSTSAKASLMEGQRSV